MPQSYTPEFKKKIVYLHEEEGHTYKSNTAEYGIFKVSISKWCSEFIKEFQTSPESKAEYNNIEILKQKKENEELRKESLFKKKQRHSLQRRLIRGLSIHRPIPRGVLRTLAATPVKYVRMPITTTVNIGRRIIILKNTMLWHKLRKSTIAIIGLTATGA